MTFFFNYGKVCNGKMKKTSKKGLLWWQVSIFHVISFDQTNLLVEWTLKHWKRRKELVVLPPVSLKNPIPVRATAKMAWNFRPKMIPKSSISYSVSSMRPVTASVRLSPDTLICWGWPSPLESTTLRVNVSKTPSGAVHVSLKLCGVMSETKRCSTSGSASGWQNNKVVLPL